MLDKKMCFIRKTQVLRIKCSKENLFMLYFKYVRYVLQGGHIYGKDL